MDKVGWVGDAMMRRIKASHVQTVLIIVGVVALLSWGVLATVWTAPYEKGAIINTIVTNENFSAAYVGPKGNGTTIRPSTEGQFIMVYKTSAPPGVGEGTFLTPNGEGFIETPLLLSSPSTTLTSYQVFYAVFIWQFTSQLGPGPIIWFSGPQGNLTASYATINIDRIASGTVFRNSQTSIFEVSGRGNYTLNYFNTGSENTTGIVSMGPSSITFTRPYLYAGVASIMIAGLLLVATGFASRSRRKPDGENLSPSTSAPLLA